MQPHEKMSLPIAWGAIAFSGEKKKILFLLDSGKKKFAQCVE